MIKTAQFIEERKVITNSPDGKRKRGRGKDRKPRKVSPISIANLIPRPFPKGVSGNPGGLPGKDVAALICREAIENNREAIYEGIAKGLIQGNPYAMQVFADRAYGKIANKHEHSGSLSLSIEQVDARIAKLLERNGTA